MNKIVSIKLFILIAYATFSVLVFSGVLSFTPWGQVQYAHDNLSLGFSDVYSHPHALRYFIVYPVYYFSEAFSWDLQVVYGLYLGVFMVLASFFVALGVAKKTNFIFLGEFFVFCFLFFLALSFFMNGRLIIGFSALSFVFLFDAFYGEDESGFFSSMCAFLALLFSGVTSGVFLSVCVSLFFVFFINFFRFGFLVNYKFFLIVLVGMVFMPVAFMLLFKNIDYFDGSYEDLLGHGLDLLDLSYWKLNLYWLLSVFFVAFVFFRYGFFYFLKSEFFNVIVVYVLFLVLSIHAYSILAVSFVCFFILLAMVFFVEFSSVKGRFFSRL